MEYSESNRLEWLANEFVDFMRGDAKHWAVEIADVVVVEDPSVKLGFTILVEFDDGSIHAVNNEDDWINAVEPRSLYSA